jgi:hypothetical protein
MCEVCVGEESFSASVHTCRRWSIKNGLISVHRLDCNFFHLGQIDRRMGYTSW